MNHRGVDSATRVVADGLFGRAADLQVVRRFFESSASGGGALLLTGEPGVGKTSVLEAAAAIARTAGSRILRATGVEFEADVGFAGLDHLLTPLQAEFDRLSTTYRDALSVALGLSDGPAAHRLVVSNAALALLRLTADVQPLVVIVDDLQWLDHLSAVTLAFVARRLAGSRVGFVAAFRSGSETAFATAGLPIHELQRLEENAAAQLIGTRFPTLAARVHQRVLAEAEGNPLALVELPTALSSAQRAALQTIPSVLPLTRRLSGLFASRVTGLPVPTRELLLLSALDGSGDLAVLKAATRGSTWLGDLAPAEKSGLIAIRETTGRLTFRHPLVRSTVVEASTALERRRAHRALAEARMDQPERRAWHLAEATLDPDEAVARLLEQAARLILRRGNAVGAVAALTRAAELSPQQFDRSRRLAEAAYIGADVTGELGSVSRRLQAAGPSGPQVTEALQTAIATSYLLLNSDGDVVGAHRLLVRALDRHADPDGGFDDALVEALHTLLLVCFFGGREELWPPFHTAVARLGCHVPAVLSLCSRTFPDPVRTAAPALDELDRTIDKLRDEMDPTQIVRIGIAAFYVDRLPGCRDALWRVARDGREGGAVASAINALLLLCFDHLTTGRWQEAQRLADEGVELGEAHGYRLLTWPGRLAQALLAAARGDDDTARVLTDQMSEWAAPRRVFAVEVYACHARTFAALGRGDFEQAYQQACAISPAGVLAPYVPHALLVLLDLVESAVRTDRRAEAAAHVAAMHEAGIAAISPRLALIATGSAAVAASDDNVGTLYEQALAVPGADRCPFELARVHLAYGEYLGRTRAITESRYQLKAALEIFERLGAQPWVTRASAELRAAGLPSGRPDNLGAATLTAQELEIAALAASGLTNRQIGERLYVSHRTVGAHLYQIFPKLGITSRAALSDALSGLSRQPRDRNRS